MTYHHRLWMVTFFWEPFPAIVEQQSSEEIQEINNNVTCTSTGFEIVEENWRVWGNLVIYQSRIFMHIRVYYKDLMLYSKWSSIINWLTVIIIHYSLPKYRIFRAITCALSVDFFVFKAAARYRPVRVMWWINWHNFGQV